MAHTFTNLLCHVIFSTKDRLPQIDADLRPRLMAYLGGIVRELNATPVIANGPDDHVHLLVGVPATLAVADLVRVVKANSSRWVHEQLPHRSAFAWQAGYGAFSVSRSNVPAVAAYIARQEEHHRRLSFRDEFITFLRKHGVEYDEKYI